MDDVDRSAGLSPCGRYRWWLGRRWASAGATLVVVGLNPSTADHRVDDPTCRRCMGFARRWGCSALRMVNLYAWRATDPAELAAVDDPVGLENDRWVADALGRGDRVLAAWGNAGLGPRADAVFRRSPTWEVLGWTRRGAPRHPLYVRGDTVPVRVSSVSVC